MDYFTLKKPAEKPAEPLPVQIKAPAAKQAVRKAPAAEPAIEAVKTIEHKTEPLVSEISAADERAATAPVPLPARPDIPSFGNTETLKMKYRDRVRDIIASNKKYPDTARRRGIQGSVTVAFSVQTDGVINNSKVASSSGFDILDRTAIEILAESSPLPVPPEEMEFQLPISFRLN